MITINGSYGEGGGAIVRTALALSTLTQQPFTVDNIRSGRKKPGLKAQHLTGIRALEQLCDAVAEDAQLGSTKLTFYPRPLKKTTLDIDIGTAGSITLLLQALLLPCCFAPKQVTLKITGGTDVLWSMPIDYLKQVLLPHLQKYAAIDVKLIKRGYYPKGGGKVEVRIKPTISRNEFTTFDMFWKEVQQQLPLHLLEQGKVQYIKGISHAAKTLQERKVAERQAQMVQDADVRIEYTDTFSPGSGITLWAVCSTGDDVDSLQPIRLGADALGERGKLAEDVGKEAYDALQAVIASGAPVDSHLADNLIQWMGLVPGSAIRVQEVTSHVKTNIYVVEQFLGKLFTIENNIIRTSLT